MQHKTIQRKAAKKAARRKLYERTRNIVHNNVPKRIRSAFLPVSMAQARMSTGNFVPFSPKSRAMIHRKGKTKPSIMSRAIGAIRDAVVQDAPKSRVERRINHAG